VTPPHDALWQADRSREGAMAAVRIVGSGPEVVLVHGSLGDYRQWTPMAAAARNRFRLTAVSRRYHWPGVAAPAHGAYTYEVQRDDLVALLRTWRQPVHLVGHSYGAGIVLLVALAEPALLRSLVLVEPAFNSLLPDEGPGLDDERRSRASMIAAVRERAAAGDHAAAARALIDWVQGSGGEFASLPAWVQAALLDNAVTAGPTVSHPPPRVSREDLGALAVPTLVVAGEHTRLYYRLIARQVAAAIPGARAIELAGAAHMTIVERPDDTAAVLASFFDEQEKARPRDDSV
jgi:pimeloyl-ACP methyl ester carboxylesterase